MFGKKLVDKQYITAITQEALRIQSTNVKLEKENRELKEIMGYIYKSIGEKLYTPIANQEAYDRFREHI